MKHENLVLSKELINVGLPPSKIWKADARNIGFPKTRGALFANFPQSRGALFARWATKFLNEGPEPAPNLSQGDSY